MAGEEKMNEMWHISADRQKRKYGFFDNMGYYMRCMWSWDKFFCVEQFVYFIPYVASMLLYNVLPAQLVQGLTDKKELAEILTVLLSVAAAILVCDILRSFFYNNVDTQYDYFIVYFSEKFTGKILGMDYEKLEAAGFKETYDNAWQSAMYGKGFSNAVSFVPTVISTGVGILLYGTIICSRSLILLALVTLSVLVSLWLLSVARKKHALYFGDIAKYSKGEEYITERCMDSSAGKDIRIYRMLDYILKKYDENLEQIDSLYKRIHNWYLARNLSGVVFGFLRDSFAYIYLIYLLINGQVTAAGFVFYLGAVSSFSSCLEGLIRQLMDTNALNTSISYFREFMEEESVWRQASALGEDTIEKMKASPIRVELKNVSYTYPGSGTAAIKNLSLTLEAGEKLALIGLNGAGKTTLVKLICGLYTPDEGGIFINGIPREQFTKQEYISLISVLFQDATFLPRTLDENITSGKTPDRKRLERALRLSGFWEKYNSLPLRGGTKLIKKVEENAADLSGGEKQKLLFARALYKNAPLIILDEPTAALDPIAENELYLNFGQAMEGKTAVYISHRLSSTRFCDRILLMEHGQITEEGTHDSLMKEKSRYAELYEMQSKYYREEEEKKQRSLEFGDTYIEGEKGGAFNE